MSINNPLEYSIIHEYQAEKQKGQNRLKNLLRNKERTSWVDDSTALHCSKCLEKFTIFFRSHHCRKCGDVFCDNCTSYRAEMPGRLGNFANVRQETGAVRLCQPCHEQVQILQNVEYWIQILAQAPQILPRVKTRVEFVLSLIGPKLDFLKQMRLVCLHWYYVSDYFWGKIRNVQYKNPHDEYSDLEKKLLWLNRDYWLGHSHFTLAFLQSLNYSSYYFRTQQETELNSFLQKVGSLTHAHDTHATHAHTHMPSCLDLLCTKYCCRLLKPYHMLILVDLVSHQGAVYATLNRLIINILREADSDELSLYLPFLTHHLIHNRIDDPHSLANFLIDRSVHDPELALEFYWNLNYYLKIRGDAHIYNYYIHLLLDRVNQFGKKAIVGSHRLIHLIQSIPDKTNLFSVKQHFRDHAVVGTNLPFDGGVKTINYLYVHQIDIKNSATHPIYLPFNCKKNYTQPGSSNEDFRVIYKTENVQQDYIVMKAIKLMRHLLKELEEIDLDIVYYRVRPIDEDSGLIEIVPDCLTVYEIRAKEDYTIWNYIVDQNPHQTGEYLRQKFIRTCATYCVITYLLGVGDRHLDNIMITKDGRLFHIDYGFILGSDPKPISQPKIRITADMIDALGGRNSPYFAKFRDLCNQLYQALRPHLNLFITYLSILSKNQRDHEKLVEVLTTRFNPGETTQTAIIKLETELYRSTQGVNVGTQLVDFFHYHNKEETLKNVWEQTFDFSHKVGNVMSTAWQVASQAVAGKGESSDEARKKLGNSWNSERRKHRSAEDRNPDQSLKGHLLIDSRELKDQSILKNSQSCTNLFGEESFCLLENYSRSDPDESG